MERLISWIEIPTNDFERAVDFYEKVLKAELKAEDFGVEKIACFPSGEGAVIYEPNYKPSPNGVIVSFHVFTISRIHWNVSKKMAKKF